ncbi:MAG: hypothetical protein U1D66_02285, partial [Erythrobacter sp.]|nr:hypothetical protein [Erythrobacter sp.]
MVKVTRQLDIPLQTPAFFQNEPLPEGAELVGWAALVEFFGVRAPVRQLSCVSGKHVGGNKRPEGPWELFDKRYRPEPTLLGHLTFALRHESMDLLILKRVLEAAPQSALTRIVQAAPTGAISRRIWFFYETLTGNRLDLPDAPAVTAVDALDPAQYITWFRDSADRGRLSARHRIRDNLLGTGAFCPIIRRTAKLEAFIAGDLSARARE